MRQNPFYRLALSRTERKTEMPRIARVAKSAEYIAARTDSAVVGERKDCAVVAVSVAAGVAYEVALAALTAAGRRPGQGTYFHHTVAALTALGFRVESVRTRDILDRYPSPHHNLQSLTTHHPDRFPKAWKDGQTYLMRTAGHILCIKDGVNHDWTRGTARRAVDLHRVVPA
jgi:hypothetical protein